MNEYLELNKELVRRKAQARASLRPSGFTVEQFLALWAVRHETLKQREVCEKTGILAPSLCRIVDFLEENKFAKISESSDLRDRAYKPTKKGERILNRYTDEVREALEGKKRA